MIPYNYVNVYGQRLNASQVDRYNKATKDIQGWIRAGKRPPKWLLDYAHQIISGFK